MEEKGREGKGMEGGSEGGREGGREGCFTYHMSYSSPAVAVVSLECNFDEVAEDTAGELDICAALTAGDLAIDITVNFDVICGEACGKRMTYFCGKST